MTFSVVVLKLFTISYITDPRVINLSVQNCPASVNPTKLHLQRASHGNLVVSPSVVERQDGTINAVVTMCICVFFATSAFYERERERERERRERERGGERERERD